MNKKKKKIPLIIKLMIIILITTIILLISLPFVLIYSSPIISKFVFDRILKFERLQINLLNGVISIENFNLSTKDKITLLQIKKLLIDIDLKKTFQFDPTISSIYIENPKTYLQMTSNKNISPPKFFETKNKRSNSLFGLDLPFSIEQVELKDGVIQLKENNKFKDLLSDLFIFIPGLNNEINNEIKPVIKGKIGGKNFNLTGKTIFEENSIKNEFKIDIINFELAQAAPYIPDIKKIRILSGKVNAKANLLFEINKKSSPSFKIFGDIQVEDLLLWDEWINKPFMEKVNAEAIIKDFDVFERSMCIDILKIKKGNLYLALSKDLSQSSTFFVKNVKNPRIFDIYIKKTEALKLNVKFNDKVNDHVYDFFNSKAEIIDFYGLLPKRSSYTLTTSGRGIKKISAKGVFILKEKYISFEEANIKKLDTSKFNIFPKFLKNKYSGTIDNFEGRLEIEPGSFYIKGNGSIVNTNIKIDDSKKIYIDRLKTDIERINIPRGEISFNDIDLSSSTIQLDKNTKISNISLKLNKNNLPYDFNIDRNNKIHKMHLNGKYPISNISGKYISKNDQFDFNINMIDLKLKIELAFSEMANIKGSADILIENPVIFKNKVPVFKNKDIIAKVGSVRTSPFYIDINEINFNSPYIYSNIDKTGKLKIFSIFDLPKYSAQKNENINIDIININNGILDFKDISLKNVFSINISDISGTIKNFPSTSGQEGIIDIRGKMNNRNNITFNAAIRGNEGIKGNIRSNDLIAKTFDPYANEYIAYNINNGIFEDLYIPFNISKDQLILNAGLTIKGLRMTRTENQIGPDISSFIPLIEDKDGKIKMDIPIRGKLSKPDFNFVYIFFNLFTEFIKNSGSNIFSRFNKFKEDDTFEIVYFKAGAFEFLLNEDEMFSNNMIKKFNDKNKAFIIEGYVDRLKDSFLLKKVIFDSKVKLYTENINEIYKKIYFSMLNKEAPQDISNEELRKIIMQNISIEESRYYALSYARINKIKEIMITNYNIDPSKIVTSEKNIYENPYFEGIDNTIGIIKSGTLPKSDQ